MRVLLSIALFCFLLSGGRVAVAQDRALVPVAVQQRVALVIGNSRYATMPLRNPANDARAMAKVLRDRGFQVIQQEDATKAQMEAAIDEFGRSLGAGSVGVVFYAGHGMQVNGRNYLIPVDAQIEAESSVRLRAVDAEALLEQLRSAQLGVVILDACRNNPFERRFRGAAGGLAQVDAPTGSLIAYATAPGKVASDGQGEHGLYTGELLKAIAQPGLRIEDVFKQVRRAVTQATNFAQVPWEASSLTGDFIFTAAAPSGPAGAASPPLVPPSGGFDTRALDLAFWQTIQNSRDPADFNDYLNSYPNGTFAELARRRLATLGKPAVAAATPAPAKPPVPAAVPIAVVSMEVGNRGGGVGDELARIVAADLGGSGRFRAVSRATPVGTVEALDLTPRFAEWRRANAQVLAIVDANRQADGQTAADVTLWDVMAEKRLSRHTATFAAGGQAAAAHRLADAVYKATIREDGRFHARFGNSQADRR